METIADLADRLYDKYDLTHDNKKVALQGGAFMSFDYAVDEDQSLSIRVGRPEDLENSLTLSPSKYDGFVLAVYSSFKPFSLPSPKTGTDNCSFFLEEFVDKINENSTNYAITPYYFPERCTTKVAEYFIETLASHG